MEELFNGKKFDALIHFAAYKAVGESVIEPIKYYHNNINALLGALIITKMTRVSEFIFSSSGAVYDPKNNPPYTEESKRGPVSPYSKTKQLCEEILENYVLNSGKVRVLSLRYFNPAGAHSSLLLGEDPNGEPNNLVPIMTRAMRENKPFTIFGNDYDTPDGTCIRDYIHVVDVAQAHIKALEYLENNPACNYDVFNIGTGKGASVLEIIEAFNNANNLKILYKIGERRPGDPAIIFADIRKAEKLLKFQTKFSLLDIMSTAWEWEKKAFQK